MTENVKIFLALASQSPKDVREHMRRHGIRKWLFLGQSYTQILEWEKHLHEFTRVAAAEMLNNIAMDLKDAFTRWAVVSGQNHTDTLLRVVDKIDERNNMSSPLFLYVCYLELVKKTAETLEEPFLIVCESGFLAELVKQNFGPAALPRHFSGTVLREQFAEIIMFAARWAKGLWGYAYAGFWARVTKPKNYFPPAGNAHERPIAVLHTCITDRAVPGDGSFHDPYYGKLSSWLTGKNYRVYTLILPYNVKKLSVLYKKVRRCNTTVLLYEDHVHLKDYAWAFRTVLKHGFALQTGGNFIKGWDVNVFLKRKRWKKASNTGKARFLLYQKMIERWMKKGVQPEIFIDVFENMYGEKPLLLALRQRMPRTRTVGYNHAPFAPLDLRLLSCREEAESNALPDWIITYGKSEALHLTENGFPSRKVIPGPALRFENIHDSPEAQPDDAGEHAIVLMLCIDEQPSAELLVKAMRAVGHLAEQGIVKPVLVKCHPMIKPEAILRAAKLTALPAGWSWTTEPVWKLCRNACCTFVIEGSSVMECFLSGVPTLVAGRETTIQQNPLAWKELSRLCRPLYKQEDIQEALKEVLSQTSGKRREKTEQCKTIIAEMFNPVTEEYLLRFIHDKESADTL